LDVNGLWLGFWPRTHDQSLEDLLLLWVHFVLCNLLLEVTQLHDLLEQLSPLLILAGVTLALKVLEYGQQLDDFLSPGLLSWCVILANNILVD